MRSHLTTLLVAALVCAGTGSAIALAGGGVGLGLEAGGSASCEQYRPGKGLGDENHCHTGPPGQTGEHPPATTPPASHFSPGKAKASLSAHGSAKVSCPFACHVVLRVRRGRKHVRVSKTLKAEGTVTVRLSRSQLRRLGRGPALVVVEVNGKVVSKRKLRFA